MVKFSQASIPFRLRIPNNTRLKNRHRNRSFPAARLFPLKVGEVMTFKQPRGVWGIPIYLGAVRTPSEHAIIIARLRVWLPTMRVVGKLKRYLAV
jgi:hypothetical protein